MNHFILRFNNVSVEFGQQPAIVGLTAQISCNTMTAVVGPNGAGKSTLLRSILGWHPLKNGEIRIGDSHAHHALPRIAYLPQRADIDWDFPITVRSVVEQGRFPSLGPFRRFSSEDNQLIENAISEMGLQDIIKRQISTLSGGQQQKVFLARALAQGADIFLLDEPFAGLDIKATEDLAHTLQSWQNRGRTILSVLHNIELVKQFFPFTLLLNTNLIGYGKTDEVLTETNLKSAYGSLSSLAAET